MMHGWPGSSFAAESDSDKEAAMWKNLVRIQFVLLISFFLLAFQPLPAPSLTLPDWDNDKAVDELENWAIKTFGPVYFYDSGEHNILTKSKSIQEDKDVAYYYEITRVHCAGRLDSYNIETSGTLEDLGMVITALYPYDYVPLSPASGGFLKEDRFAHYGDSEAVRICLDKINGTPSSNDLKAKHGSVFSPSDTRSPKEYYYPIFVQIRRHDDEDFTDYNQVVTGKKALQWESTTHLKIFPSEGKHANYVSESECENAVNDYKWLAWDENCTSDSKAQIIRPKTFVNASNNVGEGNTSLKIYAPSFSGSRSEYLWGKQQRFCGGANVTSPDAKHDVATIGAYFLKFGYVEKNCGGAIGGKWLTTAPGYKIGVYTADKDSAGTNANVYLTLQGATYTASDIFLDTDKDEFERNQQDTFTINLPSVGKITGICLKHDDSGKNAGWYPGWVSAQDKVFDISALYKFNLWLENKTLSACGKKA
jgi:hypothetical protein